MLKAYIKMTFRLIGREKLQSLLVIGGLGVALGLAIISGLFIKDELSFDRFHSKADRTYRITQTTTLVNGNLEKTDIAMGILAGALKGEFPEVDVATRILTSRTIGRTGVTIGDKRFYEGDVIVGPSSFFDVFDFPAVIGDPKVSLAEPKRAVLTESAAKKYFGETNAIGQVLKTDRFDEIVVSAVIADPPANSHLQFGMIVSEATMAARNIKSYQRFAESWSRSAFVIYFVAKAPIEPSGFTERLNALLKRNAPDAKNKPTLSIQSLADIHLYSSDFAIDTNAKKSHPIYAQVMGLIALFVLGIAGINYINIATARLSTRFKEIGLRKVIGARRADLIRQFLVEIVIYYGVALALAVILTHQGLPLFNEVAGRSLELRTLSDPAFGIAGLIVFLFLSVTTGLYPCLVLSSIQPLQVIRHQAASGKGWMRKGLVVSQFAMSVIIMVATVIVLNQLEYVQSRELGFSPVSRVVIDINNGRVRRSAMEMRTALERVTGVRGVTVTSRVPGEWKMIDETDISFADRTSEKHHMFFFGADEKFFDVFGMKLIAGRNFESMADTGSVILNEAAVRALGGGDPIGREIVTPEPNYVLRVIGIVKDFHFQSLHQTVQPALVGYWQNPIGPIDYFTLDVSATELPSIVGSLTEIHNRFDGETPIEINRLNDRLDDFYATDRRTATIFSAASIITIIIATVGLYGLISFAVERRTKEIGIRKVLGADALSITWLISKEFASLILIANVVAWPFAYFAGQRWLEGFAYRIDWSWMTLAWVAIASLVMAMITIGSHTLRAATRNPVETLKYE